MEAKKMRSLRRNAEPDRPGRPHGMPSVIGFTTRVPASTRALRAEPTMRWTKISCQTGSDQTRARSVSKGEAAMVGFDKTQILQTLGISMLTLATVQAPLVRAQDDPNPLFHLPLHLSRTPGRFLRFSIELPCDAEALSE